VPPSEPYAGHEGASPARDDAITASALNVLAGIWLVIAPWVLGYASVSSTWNDVACGGAVILLAAERASAPSRRPWLSFVNVAIGIWLIVAAFVLSSYGTEWANDIILGAIVALLGLWSSAAGSDARRRPAHRIGSHLVDPPPATEQAPYPDGYVESLEAAVGEERVPYPPPPRGTTAHVRRRRPGA
jgi:nitrate reductase NapE component